MQIQLSCPEPSPCARAGVAAADSDPSRQAELGKSMRVFKATPTRIRIMWTHQQQSQHPQLPTIPRFG
jgi:hypothetical protein